MYEVKNNRRLARQLSATICGRAAIIVDLRDAASFRMHGNRTLHWLTAAKAIERADQDARMVDSATKILDEAGNRRPGAETQLSGDRRLRRQAAPRRDPLQNASD